MQTLLHPADTRGHADHGWLKANHSFSFAGWYDPDRMGFGAMRVLNDDHIAPGAGFPTHPHRDMEIVTVPLKGALAHKDSTGGEGIIHAGEVQYMSAGRGVEHSEFNASKEAPVELFQIWLFPWQQGLEPTYAQKSFPPEGRQGQWQLLVDPEEHAGALPIRQDARISRADLAAGQTLRYTLKDAQHGVYLLVIEGTAAIGAHTLGRRDALGLWDAGHFDLHAPEGPLQVIAFEVPLVGVGH
jgi:redox-sensitive bicupin YhaK (pirin superfamily)